MNERVGIEVDGRPVSVPAGAMLLEALELQGIRVPTLCHHPSLEPSGACRLCVVEVTHRDWRGWSGLVTSCLYPVEPGLQVSTRSSRVREARRTMLELYLAECPDSEVVRALARAEGVDSTPYPAKPAADLCVRCGLCIRVCQDLGPGAIASLGRGTEKRVGPRPDMVGEDCTGCRACAHVCPTGEIQARQQAGTLRLWNREFAIPVCTVDASACRGCGVCEEACPFSIPRVVVRRSGQPSAEISGEACLGCGICAGACPTGAIEQIGFPELALDDPQARSVVFACSRSPLPPSTPGAIPVSCVGRVPVDSLLACLARGADGVLVMCRDQETCPFGPGGRLGERHAEVAEELADAAGLGPGRVRFVHPRSGLAGPAEAWTEFRDGLTRSPLQGSYAADAPQGVDRALAILAWLKTRPELTPTLPRSLAAALGPRTGREDTLLDLDDLAELDLLLSLSVPGWRLRDELKEVCSQFRKRGLDPLPVTTLRPADTAHASRLVILGRRGRMSSRAALEVVGLDGPGGSASDAQGAGDGFRCRLGPEERRRWLARLDPLAPRVVGLHALAQVRLLTRRGAWREIVLRRPPVLADVPGAQGEQA